MDNETTIISKLVYIITDLLKKCVKKVLLVKVMLRACRPLTSNINTYNGISKYLFKILYHVNTNKLFNLLT
jgi:hypothetical protein